MIKRVPAGFVVLAAVGLALTSCGTVEPGNVGVRTTLGKVNPQEVEPGLYFGVPGISRVQEFSAKEIGLDLNDLTPKARDNLTLRDLDMTVYYRVAGGSIADLYVKYAGQHTRAEGIAQSNHIINQSLTREYLQHESNLALQKFAEKGGTTTVVIPANMQTAPLINIGK